MIFNNFNELKYLLKIALLENNGETGETLVDSGYIDVNTEAIMFGDAVRYGDDVYNVIDEKGITCLANDNELIELTDTVASESKIIFDLSEEISTAGAIGLSISDSGHEDAIFPLMSDELGITKFMRRRPSKKKKKK